jgi:hypothetical protein
MTPLLDFLDRLWAASIYFTLSAPTPRAVLVSVVVPGERWEIEFRENGDVGVEVFVSRAGAEPGHTIEELFRRFGD